MKRFQRTIIVYLIVCWYLIIMDVIALIREMSDASITNCNHAFFSGGADWLNTFIWLITRAVCCLSAELVVLYLFYKHKLGKNHKGEVGRTIDTKFIRLYGSDVEDILDNFEEPESHSDSLVNKFDLVNQTQDDRNDGT